MAASNEGFIDIVELLIEKDANVNAKNNNGITSLMAASYEGYTEIASLLRNAGAEE